MSSGAVYQPTTVTYDDTNHGGRLRWQDRPISFLGSSLAQRVPGGPCGSCFPNRNVWPLTLLGSGVLCFAVGLVMLVQGAMGYSEKAEDKEDVYLVVTIFGAVFFALSILLFVFFMRLTRRVCWRGGKDHMSTANGQNLTVNPSTDFLVTAQYAPVSEVAYQPSQEDSEQSKLMPQDKLDLTNEDTDRMIERDPRIVLRPLNQTEET